MYQRKPHPRHSDYGYDVVEFDTRTHHELMISRDTSEDDLVRSIVEYLRDYEEAYPKTRLEEFKTWIESRVKMVRGEAV